MDLNFSFSLQFSLHPAFISANKSLLSFGFIHFPSPQQIPNWEELGEAAILPTLKISEGTTGARRDFIICCFIINQQNPKYGMFEGIFFSQHCKQSSSVVLLMSSIFSFFFFFWMCKFIIILLRITGFPHTVETMQSGRHADKEKLSH